MHQTQIGGLQVVWFGHASFMVSDGNARIYIDPYVLPANPEKADAVLVTHEHFDHFNAGNIKKLGTENVFGPAGVIDKLGYGTKVKLGSAEKVSNARIRAVEAYNINKFRSPGNPFHPKGLGVGYVITWLNTRIYHAGDTDHTKEMDTLQDIDVALLPIGGTYTMTVQEAGEAAHALKPRYLIPMHYNSDKYGVSGINANPEELKQLVPRSTQVVVLQPMV